MEVRWGLGVRGMSPPTEGRAPAAQRLPDRCHHRDPRLHSGSDMAPAGCPRAKKVSVDQVAFFFSSRSSNPASATRQTLGS